MIDWGLDFVKCFDPTRDQIDSVLLDWSQKHDVHEHALAHGVFEEYADFWLAPAKRTPSTASRLFTGSVLLPRDEDPRLFLHHFRRGAHYQRPAHDRLLFTTCIPPHAKSLRRLLWSDEKVQVKDLQDLEDHRISLIKIIAREMCCPRWGEKGEWRQLLRDTAGSIALVTSWGTNFPVIYDLEKQKKIRRHTVLHVLIYQLFRVFEGFPYVRRSTWHTFSEWRRYSKYELQYWLEDLQASGIDLSEYGEVEANLLRKTGALYSSRLYWRGRAERPHIRLVAFTYGPEPKDWELGWEMEADHMVGEFWELIDNPPLRIIGAWVDDA
ncbi:hypothetical protein IF1G_10250 [Cordyceps javanica]|uniref:Uncharacterized protein n=1 Tax=Cordyceps javanica TaxID=43265 RepID=A0A545UNH4_9HYPO|nr:hypothetical protein IF1G_10250 [Cordyceps javanica]